MKTRFLRSTKRAATMVAPMPCISERPARARMARFAASTAQTSSDARRGRPVCRRAPSPPRVEKKSSSASTARRLATAPPAWPPIPSTTANTLLSGSSRMASWFSRRFLPTSVFPQALTKMSLREAVGSSCSAPTSQKVSPVDTASPSTSRGGARLGSSCRACSAAGGGLERPSDGGIWDGRLSAARRRQNSRPSMMLTVTKAAVGTSVRSQ